MCRHFSTIRLHVSCIFFIFFLSLLIIIVCKSISFSASSSPLSLPWVVVVPPLVSRTGQWHPVRKSGSLDRTMPVNNFSPSLLLSLIFILIIFNIKEKKERKIMMIKKEKNKKGTRYTCTCVIFPSYRSSQRMKVNK